MVWEIIAGFIALGLLAISGAVATYLSKLAEKHGYEVKEAKVRRTIQDVVMSLHQTVVLREKEEGKDGKLSKKVAESTFADACNRISYALKQQGIELSEDEMKDKIERQILDLKLFLNKSLWGLGK